VSLESAPPRKAESRKGRPEFPRDFAASSIRGGPRGDRLARDHDGYWWWIDPTGTPTVCRGIRGVDANVGSASADAQVAGWGFDLLLPPWAEAFARRGARHVCDLQTVRAAEKQISEEGVSLPDVFDPAWESAVGQLFNAWQPGPGFVGWASDLALRWGDGSPEAVPLARPGLLQVCLGLDPTRRAFHAAWEFVLARHGGELSQVAADWGLEMASRGQVRELTRREQVIDAKSYRRDLVDFVREFSQRYFTTVSEAAAQVNAEALLLSPMLSADSPPAVVTAASRHCSLVLTETPGLTAGVAPELWLAPGWNTTDLLSPLNLGESELETVIRNGRQGLCAELQRPSVVGYVWPQFRSGDLNRHDPFGVGLVDDNGRTNVVLTQPLAAINTAAAELREHRPG